MHSFFDDELLFILNEHVPIKFNNTSVINAKLREVHENPIEIVLAVKHQTGRVYKIQPHSLGPSGF